MAGVRQSRRLRLVKAVIEPKVRSAAQGLGDQLKAMFDHIASEPLPNDLMELVDELDGVRRPRSHVN
jgi:hypothetical protein